MGALRNTLSFGFLVAVVATTRQMYEGSIFDTVGAWNAEAAKHAETQLKVEQVSEKRKTETQRDGAKGWKGLKPYATRCERKGGKKSCEIRLCLCLGEKLDCVSVRLCFWDEDVEAVRYFFLSSVCTLSVRFSFLLRQHWSRASIFFASL